MGLESRSHLGGISEPSRRNLGAISAPSRRNLGTISAAHLGERVEGAQPRPKQRVLPGRRPLTPLRMAAGRQVGLRTRRAPRHALALRGVLDGGVVGAQPAAVVPRHVVQRAEVGDGGARRGPPERAPHARARRLQVGVGVEELARRGRADGVGEEALPGGIGRHQTASDGIGRHQTASDGIGRHQTASDGIGRHQTASDGISSHIVAEAAG